MNKTLKDRWIKALRSGEYKQARKTLRRRNGRFCCLGVLCDIQGAEWKWDGTYYITHGCAAMPPGIYEAGLNYASKLSEMNDDGKSFATIADFIESDL